MQQHAMSFDSLKLSLVLLLLAAAFGVGRHFVRVVRHPDQYWGWLLLFALVIVAVLATAIAINRRLEAMASAT